jgi:hypothetical protein
MSIIPERGVIKMHDFIYFIGVDPGLQGGYAIIKQQNDIVIESKVFGVPIIKTPATKTTKAKNEYNITEIVKIYKFIKIARFLLALSPLLHGQVKALLACFTFGEGFGIWKGILGTLGFNLRLVRPMVWKSCWADKLLKKIENLIF